MARFEIGHLFDLFEERDRLVEQAASVKVVDFGCKFLVDAGCLDDVADEAAEEGGGRVGGGDHEDEAFCFDFVDGDRGAVGVFGGEDVVEEVASLGGFGVFEALFEKLVSELSLLSI